jgi:CubicO group peptidase (beta-lactamase class C family)
VTDLAEVLRPLVDSQLVPGLVAAVARGDDLEVVVLGSQAVRGRPMAQDALFRIASITKPMVTALALTFVADGTVKLDQPVDELLPELAAPVVVRSMTGPIDDTVPASRPITLRHLLTSTNGHGFPSDFSAPVAQLLVERLLQGPPQPQRVPPPDEWMSILGGIPLLHQPGEGFTYNAAFDIVGVLVARAGGAALPELMAARLFGPLGMTDTGFAFPVGTDERRTSYYRNGDDGLVEQDGPDGQWASVPAFPSGAGGLVSTLADVLAFQRMLLAHGGAILPSDLVAAMMTDQLTPAIRSTDTVFLGGQSWGLGGGVDIAPLHRWNVPGRYGWVGGTGTSAYVVPADDSIAVLLTQVELGGPTGSQVIEGFWAAAADHAHVNVPRAAEHT